MRDLEVEIRVRNNQLKERRVLAGLTQTELAQEIGISGGMYAGFEAMRYQPMNEGRWLPSALRIAAYYHLPPETLFPEAVRAVEVTVCVRKLDRSDLALLSSPAMGDATKRLLASPEAAAEQALARKQIQRHIGDLPVREAEVLRLRFGLDGDEPHTLEEIGEVFDLSNERVRQVEARALCRLRKAMGGKE